MGDNFIVHRLIDRNGSVIHYTDNKIPVIYSIESQINRSHPLWKHHGSVETENELIMM